MQRFNQEQINERWEHLHWGSKLSFKSKISWFLDGSTWRINVFQLHSPKIKCIRMFFPRHAPMQPLPLTYIVTSPRRYHLPMDYISLCTLLLEIFQEEDSEAFAVSVWNQFQLMVELAGPQHGGYFPGKARNKDRNYATVHQHFMQPYFWPKDQVRPGTAECGPQEIEVTFNRWFRMPRHVFMRTFNKGFEASAQTQLEEWVYIRWWR